jgi:multidrug efflux pump subunit AcrA (membrane-fusion protein)
MQKTMLFLALALLIAASGCSKKEEKEAEPIVPVQLTPVRQDSIRRIITADAVLFPQDQASVMPKISAPVRKFYVNRGDHVKQNQLLAELENRDLVAAAAASKGQFEQAESNLRSTSGAAIPEQVSKAEADIRAAKQTLDAAQKLLDSRQQLFKDGALARKQVDEAQVSYAQARSTFDTAQEHLRALHSVAKQEQVKGAAAQVETARGQYQAAQTQLVYSEIRSPISGVITDRPLYAGEMATPGTPLLTVMDVSRVVARANVPQHLAGPLKIGQTATITPADSREGFEGKVIVVSPAVDPNSTTVQVWVQAPNPGGRLKPGAAVHVAIVAATLRDVVTVPTEAILPSSDGGTAVMAVGADNVAHEKKVQVGVREPDKVQILGGAAVGDQVVISGGVGLQDGAKVRVRKPGEKEEEEKPGEKDKDEKKDEKEEKKGEK